MKNSLVVLLAFVLASNFLLAQENLSEKMRPSFAPSKTVWDFDAVDNYVESFVKQNSIPGLALAIVHDDQIVHLRGFGVADPSGRPVTAQTPFILGSTSKSFTALAVMQLVEAGKINLDTPVQQYLPWFRLGNDNASSAITVRHLLNHTSGIPQRAGEETQSINNSSPDALEQEVRRLSRWPLAHPPGSAFEYANANYRTAGLIVQTVSGEPFETYVEQHIFDPLEMQHSYTTKVEAQANGLASGYHYWFGVPFPAGNTPYPRGHFPAGFYISCAEDLAHALIAHLNAGQYKGRYLVSPEGMTELHRPVLGDYSMGWVGSGDEQWHHGAVADYGSDLVIDRRHHIGIAVLFNIENAYGTYRLDILAHNVRRLLIGENTMPTPPESDYMINLLLLVAVLIVEIIWLVLSGSRLRLWRGQPTARPCGLRALLLLGIPVIIELALAAYVWQRITEEGLGNALLYQPDLSIFALINVTLLVVWSGIRTFVGATLVWRTAGPGLR